MTVASQLTRIADQLRSVHDDQTVHIQDDGAITIETRLSWIRRWFSCCCARPPQEDTPTYTYFQKVFGAKRMERIQHVLASKTYTKANVEKVFVHASEVTYFDFEELLEEINGSGQSVRFYTQDETRTLRSGFSGRATVRECTQAQLSSLYQILVPFERIEHIFLHNVPRFDQITGDTGKQYACMRRRVFVYEELRRNAFSEKRWVMELTKKLVFREMPPGLVFAGLQGSFCAIQEVVHGGGSYKYFIRSLGERAREIGNFILYRNMMLSWSATDGIRSVADGLRHPIASLGPRLTFERTAAILQDPTFGHKVTAIGISLGGAHAQHDACFHRIHRLITVVAPGVSDIINQIYSAKLWRGRLGYEEYANVIPTIEHYLEVDDLVDGVGDTHLGAGIEANRASVQVHFLEPLENYMVLEMPEHKEPEVKVSEEKKSEVQTPGPREERQFAVQADIDRIGRMRKAFPDRRCVWICSLPFGALKFLKAFIVAHPRYTAMEPHVQLTLNNKGESPLLQAVLAHTSPIHDRRWERLRRLLSSGQSLLASCFASCSCSCLKAKVRVHQARGSICPINNENNNVKMEVKSSI